MRSVLYLFNYELFNLELIIKILNMIVWKWKSEEKEH